MPTVDRCDHSREEQSHPSTCLFLRSRNLIPDTLTCNLSLKLSEGEEDVQGQPAHRDRGIELLIDRYEARSFAVKALDDLGEVG